MITHIGDKVIEIPDEVWEKYKYGIAGIDYDITENGLIPLVSEDEVGKTYKAAVRIDECKQYLSNTDWVVAKIAEAEGDDQTQLREKYADILTKRKEYRFEINSLE